MSETPEQEQPQPNGDTALARTFEGRRARRWPDVADEGIRGRFKNLALLALDLTLNKVFNRFVVRTAWTMLADMTARGVWKEVARRPSSEIKWVKGHEKRLDEADSIVLCLPGAGLGTSQNAAETLAPELGKIGPVAYVTLSTDGLQMNKMARDIIKLYKDHKNLKTISFYGHSEGPLIFGGILEEMWKLGYDIPLKYGFLDCLAPDLSYTKFEKLDPVARANDEFGGSAFLTALYNMVIHGNPLDQEGVTPPLLKEQIGVLQDGIRNLYFLARAATRHKAHIKAFMPEDPSKDGIVDHIRSEPVLRKFFQYTNFVTAKLRGTKQGHANPHENTAAYLEGIRESIEASK